jgi:TetR/AcrR family transcriptional repressor of nem operon
MNRENSSASTAPASTREQIVGAAQDLIETRSYLGFSFQDVADRVGIRKASLYHHFSTKESLGVAVLQKATESFKVWTLIRTRTPPEALDAYFHMYRHGLRAGAGVCPAGALAPGWDCIDDELRQAVRDLRHVQILWLTGVFGGLAPEAGSAGARAAYVFAACQGALLTARMTGRVEDFDEAIAELKRSLPIS